MLVSNYQILSTGKHIQAAILISSQGAVFF